MEKMRKRLGNKGFSLIELIIVIAIMAVLLGIVGTQVVPYLERSREAKDLQIINSYCTAAVTAYATHAELFAPIEADSTKNPHTVYGLYYYASGGETGEGGFNEPDNTFIAEIIELTGYDDGEELTAAMTSKKGRIITDLYITIDFFKRTVTVQAVDKELKAVLDPVISDI